MRVGALLGLFLIVMGVLGYLLTGTAAQALAIYAMCGLSVVVTTIVLGVRNGQ